MASTSQGGLSYPYPSSASAPPDPSQQLPPSHNEYPTELPATLPIGKHEVPPLVNVTDLQAHLRLLGAFDRLKYTVQHPAEGIPSGMQHEHLWVLFLNRAVYRFEAFMGAIWPMNVVIASTEVTMPPLDVLMVWHTYLLVWRHTSSRFATYNSAYRTHERTLKMGLGRSLSSARTFDLFSP
jgi:hypothetical protein